MTADIAALRAALADPIDVLAVYGRDDGARDWLTAGCWVRQGEVLAHCDADLPDRIARLLDALEDATRDAERWRWLRQQQGWPESEAAMIDAKPEDFDAMADAAMKGST
jgi:hypothetical protein